MKRRAFLFAGLGFLGLLAGLVLLAGPDWQHDTSIESEVEVRFIAEGPTRTRVELEHRKLETFGDKAENMREDAVVPSVGLGSLADKLRSALKPRGK